MMTLKPFSLLSARGVVLKFVKQTIVAMWSGCKLQQREAQAKITAQLMNTLLI